MPETASRRSTPSLDSNTNWFHPNTDRLEAERKLKKAGFSEGLFLVRESSSDTRDFVLSVVHNSQVIHYQIQRRGEDALFSLSEEKRVIHGLDELISYYVTNKKSGLQHELKEHVEGVNPPAETRLHGTQNLLHRATSEGNVTVVRELLESGYRNLSAKDPDGRTALHLAVLHCQEEILQTLLKYKAKLTCRDSGGDTPLHYAAGQKEGGVILNILLKLGRADLTFRNDVTQWIPLHEAAAKGELENVLCLLNHGSPSKPRTGRNETPADLARAGGHHEVAGFIDSYPLMHPDTDRTQWYHPGLDRRGALELLRRRGNNDGIFLIRNSTKKKRFFVLSLLWKGKSQHYEIEKQGVYYFIDEGPYLPSLEHVVNHYSRFSDGLPCVLSIPVSSTASLPSPDDYVKSSSTALSPLSTSSLSSSVKLSDLESCSSFSSSSSLKTLKACTNPFTDPEWLAKTCSKSSSPVKNEAALPQTPVLNLPLPLQPQILADSRHLADSRNGNFWQQNTVTDPSPEVPPRVPVRVMPTSYPSNLKTPDLRVYENNDTLRRVRHSKDKIPRESIQLTRVIGEGEFGNVYQGIYMAENGNMKEVAVKALSKENIEPGQNEEFLREARIMMSLDHQCIVQLVGVSHGPPVLMVLELVPLGSMLDFLLDHPESVSTDMEIPLWASQIACGMLYLQSKKFVHRDLAARNILLSSKYQTKISDFGLSRVVGENNYYRSATGGRWPVKWYAPECINYGSFTHASDVWSYGIVLWEMYSYGMQPYDGKTSVETVEYIEQGHRLHQPERATNDVYDYMLKCWDSDPSQRPGFDILFSVFSDNPEYQNLTELLLTQDLQQLGM